MPERASHPAETAPKKIQPKRIQSPTSLVAPLALSVDLSQPEEVDALAERAITEFGGLHVLVNNAGVIWGEPTLEHSMRG